MILKFDLIAVPGVLHVVVPLFARVAYIDRFKKGEPVSPGFPLPSAPIHRSVAFSLPGIVDGECYPPVGLIWEDRIALFGSCRF